MNLPFMQRFTDNKPTYFAEKIWKGDYWTEEEAIEYANHYRHYLGLNREVFETCLPKLHTIRADAGNRWKAGSKIHAVFNNRKKGMYRFAPVFECKGVQTIEIIHIPLTIPKVIKTWIKIDGKVFYYIDEIFNDKLELLAKNDGFDCSGDFLEFFKDDFKGKIIHFTDLRY